MLTLKICFFHKNLPHEIVLMGENLLVNGQKVTEKTEKESQIIVLSPTGQKVKKEKVTEQSEINERNPIE